MCYRNQETDFCFEIFEYFSKISVKSKNFKQLSVEQRIKDLKMSLISQKVQTFISFIFIIYNFWNYFLFHFPALTG